MINLNDTTPAAPAGSTNVAFQASGSNVSAYLTTPYDVGFYLMGKPPATATVFKYKFPRAVSFVANFSGSVGAAPDVNATSTTTFDVQKNGVTCGSVAVAAAGTYTFTTAGGLAVSFAIGDILTYVSPAQDATLEGVSWSLVGVR